MKKNSLIILSGGMDSVTMLHEYASSIDLAVTFNYGSNHNAREIECARLHCEQLGIDFDELSEKFAPYCTKVQSIVTAESFDDVQ